MSACVGYSFLFHVLLRTMCLHILAYHMHSRTHIQLSFFHADKSSGAPITQKLNSTHITNVHFPQATGKIITAVRLFLQK